VTNNSHAFPRKKSAGEVCASSLNNFSYGLLTLLLLIPAVLVPGFALWLSGCATVFGLDSYPPPQPPTAPINLTVIPAPAQA